MYINAPEVKLNADEHNNENGDSGWLGLSWFVDKKRCGMNGELWRQIERRDP